MQEDQGTKNWKRRGSYKTSVIKLRFVYTYLLNENVVKFNIHIRKKQISLQKKQKVIQPNSKDCGILVITDLNGLKVRVLIYQAGYSTTSYFHNRQFYLDHLYPQDQD